MTWDEYFIGIAYAAAAKSKDPATKVGAVLVDQDRHVIGLGFNGMATGVDERALWADRETKYKYVIHAEANCLIHATSGTKNAVLYTTLNPCDQCMKLIASAGIKEVVYAELRTSVLSEDIAERAGITLRKVPYGRVGEREDQPAGREERPRGEYRLLGDGDREQPGSGCGDRKAIGGDR